MVPVGYDTIAPNIASVNVQNGQVVVAWRCPVTGRDMGQSTAGMSADPSMSARVQANVKRSIASEIIYGATRFITGLIGGAAGRVISNAAYTAANDLNTRATAGVDYTEASRRAAVVNAFESVRSTFVWDEHRQKFVAPTDTQA